MAGLDESRKVTMLALLVPLFWLLVARFAAPREGSTDVGCPRLVATVITTALVVVLCETLSPFHAFARPSLAAAWSVAVLGAGLLFWRRRHQPNGGQRPARPPFAALEKILLAGVSVIVVAVGLSALAAPPTNADSLIYHMARVAHWVANQSVAFYPTHITRQDAMNPLAEWGIAHLQILTGGDRFANLIQFASMVGSVATATRIARQLGADRQGQILALVVTATIPMGILQGSSTQNDYVATFWLLAFASCVLDLRRGLSRQGILCSGATLGFALLTKATSAVFVLPWLVWLLAWSVATERRERLRAVAAIAGVALLINLGHALRNQEVFGSPLGPLRDCAKDNGPFLLESHSPAAIASNLLRNSALQLNFPNEVFRAALERATRKVHSLLPIGIDDPRTTWCGTVFTVPYYNVHEDGAGNPLHFVLGLLAFGVAAVSAALRRRRELLAYGGCVFGGWLLFNLMLKWQPWHSRLLLPVVVLSAPFLAIVCAQCLGRVVNGAVALVLLVAASNYAFTNASRPLVGEGNVFAQERIHQYFVNRPDLEPVYRAITQAFVNRQAEALHVGLIAGQDASEYLLWALTERDGRPTVVFDHVGVGNATRTLGQTRPPPRWMIATPPSLPDNVTVSEGSYRKQIATPALALFTLVTAARAQ